MTNTTSLSPFRAQALEEIARDLGLVADDGFSGELALSGDHGAVVAVVNDGTGAALLQFYRWGREDLELVEQFEVNEEMSVPLIVHNLEGLVSRAKYGY